MRRLCWLLAVAVVLVCAGCGERAIPQESMEYLPGDQMLDLSNAPEETESGASLALEPLWERYTLLHMSAQRLESCSPHRAKREIVLEVSVGKDLDAFRLHRNGEIWLRGKLLATDPELGEAMWQTWIAHNEYMMERWRKEQAAYERIFAGLNAEEAR